MSNCKRKSCAKEHEAARWLTKDELNNVEWLPADITLIEKIRNLLSMTR